MHEYRKKAILLLSVMLILFLAIFFYAYSQIKKDKQIFDIGLPDDYENHVIAIFSVLAILRIIYEIYKVEHAKDFELRVKGSQ